MEDTRKLFTKEAHSAIICGQTGCGKTEFILDLLETTYRNVFDHVIILCPTLEYNKAYQSRGWVKADPEVYLVDPGERLHDFLRAFFSIFAGEPTLYVIDDCSDLKALTQKRHMLSRLAFSGRHADQSLWVLTQKYNSVLTDVREQTKWVALFHCKDRDSFFECVRENDVIPSKEEQRRVRQSLAETKHSKLILKTGQPVGYSVISQ